MSSPRIDPSGSPSRGLRPHSPPTIPRLEPQTNSPAEVSVDDRWAGKMLITAPMGFQRRNHHVYHLAFIPSSGAKSCFRTLQTVRDTGPHARLHPRPEGKRCRRADGQAFELSATIASLPQSHEGLRADEPCDLHAQASGGRCVPSMASRLHANCIAMSMQEAQAGCRLPAASRRRAHREVCAQTFEHMSVWPRWLEGTHQRLSTNVCLGGRPVHAHAECPEGARRDAQTSNACGREGLPSQFVVG